MARFFRSPFKILSNSKTVEEGMALAQIPDARVLKRLMKQCEQARKPVSEIIPDDHPLLKTVHYLIVGESVRVDGHESRSHAILNTINCVDNQNNVSEGMILGSIVSKNQDFQELWLTHAKGHSF